MCASRRSVFGLWTISTGWWGNFTEGEAIALMHKALDLGITLFDAADTYGNGYSEELNRPRLPQAARPDRDRHEGGLQFLRATAASARASARFRRISACPFIRAAVEKALTRLRTDRIDILQLHNIRMPQVEDDALWTLLEALVQEGKIRSYGAALGPAIGWLYEGSIACSSAGRTCCSTFYNALEPHPGRQIMDEGEAAVTHEGPTARTRYLIPRHPLQRHARGQVHGRDHFPADRPPQPSPALVAAQRPEENRDAAIPHRARTARWARPRSSGCWPIRASACVFAEHLRRRSRSRNSPPRRNARPSPPTIWRESRNCRSTNFGVEGETPNYKGTMTRETAAA